MRSYVLWSMVERSRWILVSFAAAVIGIVDLVVPAPKVLIVATAVLAGYLLVVEIIEHRRRFRSTRFERRESDSFLDVRQGLKVGGRFQVFDYVNGTFIHDSHVSRLVMEGRLPARLLPDSKFVAPSEFKKLGDLYLQNYLDESRNDKRVIWNDPVLGWATDVGRESDSEVEEVGMIPGTFYQRLRTDDFALNDVMQSGAPRSEFGRQLFIDKRGHLRDFGSSWLLNGIGTSTLAFTKDGKLVLVEQSRRNARSQGLFAPSGSGSLEPQDFRGSDVVGLGELAASGATRELCEETGILPQEVAATVFLGFGRWLDKSACPELFSLTLLSIDSDELARRPIPAPDRTLVESRPLCRLIGDPMQWDPNKPGDMLPAEFRGRLSVPLSAALSLLALAAKQRNPLFAFDQWTSAT